MNIEGAFANEEQSWQLLNNIAQQGVIYFAYNSKINEDNVGHKWIGSDFCPQCGEHFAEQYSRVVGFITAVSTWSTPRRKEWNERTWFNIGE